MLASRWTNLVIGTQQAKPLAISHIMDLASLLPFISHWSLVMFMLGAEGLFSLLSAARCIEKVDRLKYLFKLRVWNFFLLTLFFLFGQQLQHGGQHG